LQRPTRSSLSLLSALIVLLLAPIEGSADKSGYRYTIDWTSVNTEAWLRYLEPLRGRPDARGLEIGCFEGRSTLWFLENVLTHPSASMTCIDVFTDTIEANFDHNVKRSGQGQRVVKRKGYSQDVLRGLPLESYDFIYIDGCHLASCALTDAVLSWDLLKAGGFIIFDDYMFKINAPPSERPKIAIDAFMEAFIDQIHVRELGHQVILEKRRPRGDDDLVGKPIVHDDKGLEKLRWIKFQNQKRKAQKRKAQKQEAKEQEDPERAQ
jgi:predicted O-methyltransferase YrrM